MDDEQFIKKLDDMRFFIDGGDGDQGFFSHVHALDYMPHDGESKQFKNWNGFPEVYKV